MASRPPRVRKEMTWQAIDWEEAILQKSILLQEVDTDVFCGSKDDLFKPPGARGVFGGQTISQSLHAAILSAPNDFAVHSMHGYFLLAGDADRNVLFHVERVREGKSFATRTVQAKQRGRPIFIATVQFHKPEPSQGLEVAEPLPKVFGPEGLKSDREMLLDMINDQTVPSGLRQFYKSALSWPARAERRATQPPAGTDPLEPVTMFWTRVSGRLSNDREIHMVCLAYMSDMGMLSCAYVPFGGIRQHPPAMMVSLDHSMWFHSDQFRADDWLLFKIRCVRAGGARILSFCKVWTRSGTLVFSCAQEGLARHSEPITPMPSQITPMPSQMPQRSRL